MVFISSIAALGLLAMSTAASPLAARDTSTDAFVLRTKQTDPGQKFDLYYLSAPGPALTGDQTRDINLKSAKGDANLFRADGPTIQVLGINNNNGSSYDLTGYLNLDQHDSNAADAATRVPVEVIAAGKSHSDMLSFDSSGALTSSWSEFGSFILCTVGEDLSKLYYNGVSNGQVLPAPEGCALVQLVKETA